MSIFKIFIFALLALKSFCKFVMVKIQCFKYKVTGGTGCREVLAFKEGMMLVVKS